MRLTNEFYGPVSDPSDIPEAESYTVTLIGDLDNPDRPRVSPFASLRKPYRYAASPIRLRPAVPLGC